MNPIILALSSTIAITFLHPNSHSDLPHYMLQDIIMQAKTVQELKSHLAQVPAGSCIFIDVDDTLITPISHTFRVGSPWYEMIGDIKKNRTQIPNSDFIISNWRRTRKTMLVDPAWPTFIQELKATHMVCALTKLDTGKLGSIASMEIWRHTELASFGIEFSRIDAFDHAQIHQYPDTNCSHYRGIFITGTHKKSEVLELYRRALAFEHVVIIDDKREMVDDIIRWCQAQNIPYTAILFRGIDTIPGTPDPLVAEYQKQHLLTHAEWLEDEEALARIKKSE